MNKTKRNVAVVAGLTAVLALSPVAVPAATAFATGGQTGTELNSVSDPAETVTVTFVHCDGTGDNTVKEVKSGSKLINCRPTLTRDGYKFGGWYTDPNYSEDSKININSDKATSDMVLYAKWNKNPVVTYFNEVSYEDMESVEAWKTQNVGYDDSFGKPTPDLPDGCSSSDYKFDGWFTDPSFDEQYRFSGWNAGVTEDTVLYAKWNKAPMVYYYLSPESEKPCCTVKVDFDASPDELEATLNKTAITKQLGDTIPDGYEIEGFYTDPDYTEKFTHFAYVDEDTTLYIKFNKQPVVTYDFQYEGVADQETPVNLGDYADFVTSDAREGYEVVGWYTDADCTEAYEFTKPVMGDVTLYAKWDRKSYDVTFNDGIDGTTDVVESVKHGEKVSEPADPTREGYTFNGWYTDAACTTPYDFATPVKSDVTLYAKWTAVEAPTDPEKPGTDPEQPTDPENPGTDTDDPTKPENPGTDPEKPGTGTGTDDPTKPGAEEPAANTVTVTFDDCLESTENVVAEVESGATVAKPADPTCEGYTFAGWYADTALSQAWDFATPVTEDMTLWAKWTKNATDDQATPDNTDKADPNKANTTAEKNDEAAIPNTGDATLAVSGIAGLGAALAGAGALIRRRR